MDNTDTVKIFYDDAIANGLTILGPDINVSGYRFTPVDRATIRYGLGAIKGTGQQAVECIVMAREAGGPFGDLFDFCRRVDKRLVNRRTIEALIRAGAFDALDDHRARLMASVGIAIDAAEQAERDAMQVSLFDMLDDAAQAEQQPHYIETMPWAERDRLREEKTALGFFFSGHPFHAVKQEVSHFVHRPLAWLEARKEPQVLAGLVTSVRTKLTARGKMAFVQLDDASASLEVSVFNETFEAYKNQICVDEVLVVEGKVQNDDFAGEGKLRVVADRLFSLVEARTLFARQLRIFFNGLTGSNNARAAALRLQSVLRPFTQNGTCTVYLNYRNANALCELKLGDDYRVRLEDALLNALSEWLKPECVQIEYQ